MKTISILNLITGISMFILAILSISKNLWNEAIIDMILGSTNIIISYICYSVYLIKKYINRYKNERMERK